MKYYWAYKHTDNRRESVNRQTFTCPVCQMKNLDRGGLLKHVHEKHPKDKAV